jgi:glycosyltransferase involved in cell wall biosynthesis
VLSAEPGAKAPVASRRVFIGPANSAGQGYAWARAISRHCPDATAANFTFQRGRLDFPADHLVSAEQFRHDAAWAEEFRAHVANTYTHAILESNRPVFGARQRDARADIGYLGDAGLGVALMAHGSDVRIPSVFSDRERWSPFPNLDPSYVANLERKARDTVELFTTYSGPVFVSTLSLLSFVPNGSWCPVVVDPDSWATPHPALAGCGRPVVVHAPSNPVLKGSELLDRLLAELVRDGVIEYRRYSDVPPSQMPALYREADIVVDQVSGIADYGVAACEAMAAGRIVVSHVATDVREHVRQRTGLELPIIEATPENVCETIIGIVDDHHPANLVASLGPAFVRQVHDGRLSAETLASFVNDHVVRQASPVASRSRGRIVMLVDNNVTPDSRVQKQARSAAERGWDVTLLGHKRGPGRTRWKLGKAKVQLVEVGTGLAKQLNLMRGGHLRSPLAYHGRDLAAYRVQQVKARKADLSVRRAAARLEADDTSGAIGARAEQASLFARRLWLAAARRWVDLRATKTVELYDRRNTMYAPLDRWTTSFWLNVMGDRSWRRLDPSLWEWELAYGPIIDRLKPDIIHANDFRMLGVGARAAMRARAKGRDTKLVWDAHEFLPGIEPWNSHPRWHIAQQAHEREYARQADAVITVSEKLADLLVSEHGLATRPTVVLNAPDVRGTTATKGPSLREACGIASAIPLLVYSGTAAPKRGLDIMVEALAVLTDVHIALVVPAPKSAYVTSLQERAAALSASERLHILPYVPVDHIVSFLSGADAGVIPILHFPNHEIALITKFLEYSHARLPIVVSDVKTMAETVRRTGQGEVFEAENLGDFVRAVKAVLAAPEHYRQAYDAPGLLEQWSWENSAAILDAIFDRLRSEQLNNRG